MIEHSPNITCLRFSDFLFETDQVHLLLRAYGHQLNELKLFNGACRYDKLYPDVDKVYHEWIKLLVKYGNSNRLRKLGLHVDSAQQQEELDFVCQNVSLEIEFLKTTMLEEDYRNPMYSRFPDIYRL